MVDFLFCIPFVTTELLKSKAEQDAKQQNINASNMQVPPPIIPGLNLPRAPQGVNNMPSMSQPPPQQMVNQMNYNQRMMRNRPNLQQVIFGIKVIR